jgi:trigger factor
MAATPFDLPEELVAREAAARKDQVNQSLERAGLSLAEYLANAGEGETAERFWDDLAVQAEKSFRMRLLIDKLVEALKPPVTQNDLTQFVLREAQERGWSPQQMLQDMQEHDHLAEWMTQIRRAKALNALVLQGAVTDTAGRPVDFTALLAEPAAPEADDEAAAADDAPLLVDIAAGPADAAPPASSDSAA